MMSNKITTAIATAAMCLVLCLGAQAQSMTQHAFTSTSSALRYWLYTPAAPDTSTVLVVYLHGGSGKGNDLSILLNNGFPKFLHDGDLGTPNAYVVIPQVPTGVSGWGNLVNSVRDLVVHVADSLQLSKSRISLTGHSMGGTGTWTVALRYPRLFARVAPLSGSITLSDANLEALATSDIWAVVGSADTIVDPQSSIDFMAALNEKGNKSRITVIEGYTHFDVPEVYKDKTLGLTEWLTNYSSSAGITQVTAKEAAPADAAYYDLQGRRVAAPGHGLYIHAGKLVLVK